MDRSPVVTLPQSFLTHAPEMRWYNGLVWYQRHFIAHPKPGQRAFLRFGAVDYHAYVSLNGKRVGEHVGGFTPFAFEVTGLLRDGDNRLTVGVGFRAHGRRTCRRRSPTGRIMAASPGR